jgi:hypothetical protein
MAKLTEAGATESNSQASKKKKTAAKAAKLKSSAWYRDAVRSIGINRDEVVNRAATSTGFRNDKAQRSLDPHWVEKGDRQ